VDPVSDPLLFFLVVPGIEPGQPDLWSRTLTTRPQRRSITRHMLTLYLTTFMASEKIFDKHTTLQ
jgi:hypothetical protein